MTTHVSDDAFDHDEGARASSLKSVHKLSMHDPIYEQQLLRDLAIINERTRAELGPSPRKGLVKQTRRKPNLAQPAQATVLREGMCGFPIMELQAHLKRLGYTDARGRPLAADGRFGPVTRMALLGFQVEHGVEANGVCDQATRALVQNAAEDLGHVETVP